MGVTPPVTGRYRWSAVAAGTAVVIALVGAVVGAAFHGADTAEVANASVLAFVIGTIAVVGAVVTLTVPANRVGWLLLAGAATSGVAEAFVGAGEHGVLTAPGSVRGAAYFAAIGPSLRAVSYLLVVVAVPLVFPDGRLPGRRWRWLACTAGGAVVCLFFGNVLDPHAQDTRLPQWQSPLGLPARYAGVADTSSALGVLLAVISIVGAVVGLITRWRRGGAVVRQQLLLFALACCIPVTVLVVVILVGSLPGWVFGAAIAPLPITIGIATLNHGLYDLRRAANRTLLWLTMSGCIVGIYALVVSAAAAVVPDRQSWWVPALAAGVAALLLIPLYQSIQRAVNRVVYGHWHEPYELLADLGERLEAASDVDRLLDATIAELTTGLGLREVSVRDRDGAAIVGALHEASTMLPLHAYGATVGWLSYQLPDRQLSGAEQRLVRDFARHLGGALHARSLRDDLQRARERLVLTREDERRRLRRDLHDGIGPALAGLTLKSETAQTLLPSGADAACRQLQDLTDEIRRTVLDVRRVVEGLRPPALDELGLVSACTQAVGRLAADARIDVTVQAADDPSALPAAVEVAAYRIIVEAVTNVVRHSHATRCDVTLTCSPSELTVTITDNGTGLPTSQRDGNGLAIMRERAEELGGSTTVTDMSPGVRAQARLPIIARPTPSSNSQALHT